METTKQSVVVLFRVHRIKSEFRPTLWCCTRVLRQRNWIYLDSPCTISLKHPFQLEKNCEGPSGIHFFSLLNDRVKLYLSWFFKYSKMFLFHYASHDYDYQKWLVFSQHSMHSGVTAFLGRSSRASSPRFLRPREKSLNHL